MQFYEFIKILYQDENGNTNENTLNKQWLSRLERYTLPFHFIIDGKKCQPKVTITIIDAGDVKFTEREILLGHGGTKAVIALNSQAVFLPQSELSEEIWLRIIKEEIQFSQTLSQYNLLTQDLNYKTVTIVDNKTNEKATIKVMVAKDFNQYGQENDGYVWDTKSQKKYGKKSLLFDNDKKNMTNPAWVKAILKPIMRDVIVCLCYEFPYTVDTLNYFVKKTQDHQPPQARLMLYDFTSKGKEKTCHPAPNAVLPNVDKVVEASEEALTKIFRSISYPELESLGFKVRWVERERFFRAMREFIKKNEINKELAIEMLADVKSLISINKHEPNNNETAEPKIEADQGIKVNYA